MKSKYQLIILNIFVTIISIYFTFAVYDKYRESLAQKRENYIQKTIEINRAIIKNSFLKIKIEIEADRALFQKIHKEYTNLLRKNPKQNLNSLKKEILKKYHLKNRDIHLFLLDKEYTITATTYEPDLGFKLALVPDAKVELDRAKDGKIYQSKSISIDTITSDVKSYSYSKINSELYFEMGFINKNISNILKVAMAKIKLLTNEKSNLYRIEQKLDNTEYYDNILYKDSSMSKEEYLNSRVKFDKAKESSNPIIKANREGEIISNYLEESMYFYIPLIKKDNEYLKLVGDFVLELFIDRKDEITLNKKIELYYYIFLFFHITFLLIIYYFTKKYYDAQIELNKKIVENRKLLDENSSFISAVVNQIKTPLSVIMNNFFFIEKLLENRYNKYLVQISSSIKMVSNSYEDLNYITENKRVSYPIKRVNLSNFLEKRVDFFENIVKTKNKNIISLIDQNLFIEINEIELERLIDNNLSNASKYAEQNRDITVQLESDENYIYLKFYSFSKEIESKDRIFERNYQGDLKSKQSLGLGLSMVKSICLKYKIEYKVEYKDNQNIFIYRFKSNESDYISTN